MGTTSLGFLSKSLSPSLPLTVAAALAGLALLPVTASAQPPSGFPAQRSGGGGGATQLGSAARRDVTNGTDPTDIVQRAEVRNLYSSYERGGQTNVTDFIYDMTPFQNTVLRFQAPFVFNDPNGLPSESGLGDVRVRPLVKVFDQDYAKVAAYVDGKFATHTDPLLADGTGRNDVSVGGFGSYEFTRELTGIVEVSQVVASFGGDEENPRNDQTRIRPFVVYELPEGWWLQGEAEYARTWIEANDEDRLFLRGQAGWQFGPNQSAFATLSTQTAGENASDLGIEVGARYVY